MGAGRGRVLARGQARLGPRETALGVDMQALHGAEIEDDPAVARAVPGEAVRTATDGQLEARIASEEDGSNHVRCPRGPNDQRRAAIVGPVLDKSGDLVAFVVGAYHSAGDPRAEGSDVERDGWVVGRRTGEGHRCRILSGWVAWGRWEVMAPCSRRPTPSDSGQAPVRCARRMTTRMRRMTMPR